MTNREAIGDGANPCNQVAKLMMRLDKLGYRGDYSFEVFNDGYQQMPMERVCARAFRAAEWLRRGATKKTHMPRAIRRSKERSNLLIRFSDGKQNDAENSSTVEGTIAKHHPRADNCARLIYWVASGQPNQRRGRR